MLGDPVMRSIVIVSTAVNLAFTGPLAVGLPWLVLVGFGGDALELGLLFAAFGAGSLVGAVLGGSLRRPRGFGWLVLGLAIGAGVGLAAIGVAPNVQVAAAILLAIGVDARLHQRRDDRLGPGEDRPAPARSHDELHDARVGRRCAAVDRARRARWSTPAASAMFVAAGALVVVSGLIAIASGLPRRMSEAGATIPR